MFPFRFKKTVKLLISKGTDVNKKDINGDTPLHYASQGGSLDAVKVLLSEGTDINAKNRWGMTPFDTVLSRKYPSPSLVEFYESIGAKRNKRTKK
ncbi:MAG: ankyrin repeat domain-containing protein [Candidatus Aureabacteria bacterium]|nr:ankyrin repeat domain-containing protein [Candidatus Auribacterota bacterium]